MIISLMNYELDLFFMNSIIKNKIIALQIGDWHGD